MTEPISYRNQAIDLLCKSMDWFLYDRDLLHEGVNQAEVTKNDVTNPLRKDSFKCKQA